MGHQSTGHRTVWRTLAVALAATAALGANAQEITLRWGDVVPATHPSVQMIDRIAADVKAKSGGRIAVQSFPAGQLGSSRDMIEAVANGTQQVVTEGAANFGGRLRDGGRPPPREGGAPPPPGDSGP